MRSRKQQEKVAETSFFFFFYTTHINLQLWEKKTVLWDLSSQKTFFSQLWFCVSPLLLFVSVQSLFFPMNSRTVRKKILFINCFNYYYYSIQYGIKTNMYASLIMIFTGSLIHRNVKFSFWKNQLHPIEVTVITAGRTGNAMLISLGMDPALRGAAAEIRIMFRVMLFAWVPAIQKTLLVNLILGQVSLHQTITLTHYSFTWLRA